MVSWLKRNWGSALALAAGCLVAFLILEFFLRVAQPFKFRVRAGKIILPVHQSYTIHNSVRDGLLDPVILHRKNSLGFRGQEPPPDFDRALTLVTVGGSTTECFYLADGKTWPDRLEQRLSGAFRPLWLNNAGLEGHSTFGHIILLEDYLVRLKPKVILFMIGINDLGSESIVKWDNWQIVGRWTGIDSAKRLLVFSANYSEILAVALNLYRHWKAKRVSAVHEFTWEKIERRLSTAVDPEAAARRRREERELYLPAYEERVRRLIALCRGGGIEPVFITQATIYGYMNDNMRALPGLKTSQLEEEIIESYNDVLRRIGGREGILVVDLARELPRSPRLIYDTVHYSNEGAEAVAAIVARRLAPHLRKEFPEFSAVSAGAKKPHKEY